MEVVIPPAVQRLEQRDYDRHTYKERHLAECFFEKLTEFRLRIDVASPFIVSCAATFLSP